MTFTVGPARPRPGKVRPRPGPQPAKLLLTSPGPARACKFQARTRPVPQNVIESWPGSARPGPWAAGWPGPRAEARPVQDPSVHLRRTYSCVCVRACVRACLWAGLFVREQVLACDCVNCKGTIKAIQRYAPSVLYQTAPFQTKEIIDLIISSNVSM